MIADNLKNIRVFKGKTRSQLSKDSGVNETTIWKVETGKCDPSVATLEKLANALGVNVSIFFASKLNFSQEIKEAG